MNGGIRRNSVISPMDAGLILSMYNHIGLNWEKFVEERGDVLTEMGVRMVADPGTGQMVPIGDIADVDMEKLLNLIEQWNACDAAVDFVCDNEVHICFDTAWSSPTPVIQKLIEKYPALEFNGYFSDEDSGGSNHGHWTAMDGVLHDEEDLSDAEIFEYCWEFSPDEE